MTDVKSGAPERSEKAQRLRLRFARGPEAAEIGHLDLSRIWTEAFEHAGAAVSYSQGNRPHPRLTLAAGLPMGVTSEAELLDVVLARRMDPDDVVANLQPHLPLGLEALECREVGIGVPSLPSVIRWAEYGVDVPITEGAPAIPAIEEAVSSFLCLDSLPWEDHRGEKTRRYDLRPLVQELRVEEQCGDTVRLSMRLRCDAAGVGRPDQVVMALGLGEAARIHRRRLVLAGGSPARAAWRTRGRFQA